MRTTDDDVTDPDEYLKNNPIAARCREDGHDFPRSSDVPLVEAYRDTLATHQRVLVCPHCKTKKFERFSIKVRGKRVVRSEQLPTRTDYTDAVGYLAKGTRISRRYVKEQTIRRTVEAQLAAAPQADKRQASQSTARKGSATTRTRRRAAVA
jgi:hypothetical protein